MKFPHTIVPCLQLLSVFQLFLFPNLSAASSLHQGTSLPYMTSDVKEVSGKSFDYIIVGGGTAGCPLAATLSKRFSVLVVERGGSPYANPLVMEKKYFGFSLLQTDQLSSVAQAFTSTDGVSAARGRVLGGSSAINFGFYSRASEDSVKRAGWDRKLVKQAYEWVESKLISKPELTGWQSAVKSGMLEAGLLPYNGFTWEHIVGTKIGGTTFDNKGKRHPSADLLMAENPENVTVLLNATVKNVLFHSNGGGNERVALGIRFIKSDGNPNQFYEAYLKKPDNLSCWGDVILSAGALGSPQILMLSGIGPKNLLRKFKIPPVSNFKEVGLKMQDNPGISLLLDPKPEIRLPDPATVAGIAKGFEFIVEAGIAPVSLNGTTRIRVSIKLAFPASEGKLELNSTDPRQNPVVEFNYLKEKGDLEACARMIQLADKVAKSKSVVLFVGAEPQTNLPSTQDGLKEFCKKNVRTFYHYHGGCTVGSVVGNDYRVYGVKGLRVVDGSTFVESPGTNPMATLLMLGRYQGIKILRERKNAFACRK